MSTNAVGWCAHQPADALQQLQRVLLVQCFRRPRRHKVLQVPKDGRGGGSGWRRERLAAVARGLHQRGDGVQQVEQRPVRNDIAGLMEECNPDAGNIVAAYPPQSVPRKARAFCRIWSQINMTIKSN